jgi:hypothetical protein
MLASDRLDCCLRLSPINQQESLIITNLRPPTTETSSMRVFDRIDHLDNRLHLDPKSRGAIMCAWGENADKIWF